MKNRFKEPQQYDHEIIDEDGAKVGEVRVTPTSIKWKPKGKHKYLQVSLRRFAEWIESDDSEAKAVQK